MIKPTKDRLLIDPAPHNELSDGGIYVPPRTTTFAYGESNRPVVRETSGVVVAVGPGRPNKRGIRHPLDVRPGEKVCFSDSCSRKFEYEGKTYLMIREQDVLGIVEGKAEFIS